MVDISVNDTSRERPFLGADLDPLQEDVVSIELADTVEPDMVLIDGRDGQGRCRDVAARLKLGDATSWEIHKGNRGLKVDVNRIDALSLLEAL